MVTKIWVSIGLGNGLLPESSEPLPEPMSTIIKGVLCYSPESNFNISVADISLKISNLRLQPNLPGAKEF